MSAREALILAGPNGSGKSTLTADLTRYGIALPAKYINPDDIARRLREQDPEAATEDLNWRAYQEGRRLRQEFREQGISFALETVFSHPSGLLDLQKLRDAGYRITLAVVTTCDPEINVARVTGRVLTGGHAVEVEKIRKRHGRFMALLPRMVEMANLVMVFDASTETRLCYQREHFAVETNVPDYLKHSLIEPLEERKWSCLHLEGLLAQEELLELPDEEAGIYEGIICGCTPHHALQKVESGRCVRHDRLLLQASVETGNAIRIVYKEGESKIASVDTP